MLKGHLKGLQLRLIWWVLLVSENIKCSVHGYYPWLGCNDKTICRDWGYWGLPLNFTYLSLSSAGAPGEGTIGTLILIADISAIIFQNSSIFNLCNINFILLFCSSPKKRFRSSEVWEQSFILFLKFKMSGQKKWNQ